MPKPDQRPAIIAVLGLLAIAFGGVPPVSEADAVSVMNAGQSVTDAAKAAKDAPPTPCAPFAGMGLRVRVCSNRAGHLFTDSESVDVRAQVGGAALGETVVDWVATEHAGRWRQRGRVAVADGDGEARLDLRLPGRGLYRVTLVATTGTGQATAETSVAVVFSPRPTDPASNFGIFFTPPLWFMDTPEAADAVALQHRLLGASWARVGWWANSYGKITIEGSTITADWSKWKSYTVALRRAGVNIYGSIGQIPRELSSRPDDETKTGDAGPMWGRVIPRDWALWDQLMEKLAADFRDEVSIWEIQNEPDIEGMYWAGTAAELVQLMEHTSRAIKRGNPAARIAGSGFTSFGPGSIDYANRVLGMGFGKHIDIFSVHYSDERANMLGRWRELLDRHGLDLPLWVSEEKSEIPIANLAGSVGLSIKFLHVAPGDAYDSYRPLARQDFTLFPAGIHYAVGAWALAGARSLNREERASGWRVTHFEREGEAVAALVGTPPSPFLEPEVEMTVEPLAGGQAPVLTDRWGRSRPLAGVGAQPRGRTRVPLTDVTLFLTGARRLKLADTQVKTSADVVLAEAEGMRRSSGWTRTEVAGFSGGATLDLGTNADPPADGYWIETTLEVPRTGYYQILFSGTTLGDLAAPRTVSPFTWTLDGVAYPVVSPLPQLDAEYPGLPEPASELGQIHLEAGSHPFRLELSGRRAAPDTLYAIRIDAIVLRPNRARSGGSPP